MLSDSTLRIKINEEGTDQMSWNMSTERSNTRVNAVVVTTTSPHRNTKGPQSRKRLVDKKASLMDRYPQPWKVYTTRTSSYTTLSRGVLEQFEQ